MSLTNPFVVILVDNPCGLPSLKVHHDALGRRVHFKTVGGRLGPVDQIDILRDVREEILHGTRKQAFQPHNFMMGEALVDGLPEATNKALHESVRGYKCGRLTDGGAILLAVKRR